MGIDGFHKWIKTDYESIYYDIYKTEKIFHHLYIDLNYLLHLCHYNSNDEVHLLNKMSVVILDICKKVSPTISLNLFCDGTAPFAKMVLQRERRMSNKNDDIFKTSLNFTPGTNFIKDISIKLEKCIKTIKTYYNIKVNIDSIAPGEAEIKIKNKIIQNYNKNNNHSHILVTNDADVVLILASDETYTKTNILLNDTVLPINELLMEHFKKYNINFNKNNINNLDFVFLNILLGNDYIPKIAELSPKKIWNSYLQNSFKHKYLLKINKQNNIIKYDFNKDFLIDILNDCIGKIPKTKILKNNKLHSMEIYKNYFDGILWTITMYNLGRCYNYNYICNSNKPIDILNLIIYLYNFNIDDFEYIETNPIPSILCGILLLPENASRELIDKKYFKFIDNNKEIYKKDFKINIDFINNIKLNFDKYIENL
jgi:5'-3' exonuclease